MEAVSQVAQGWKRTLQSGSGVKVVVSGPRLVRESAVMTWTGGMSVRRSVNSELWAFQTVCGDIFCLLAGERRNSFNLAQVPTSSI